MTKQLYLQFWAGDARRQIVEVESRVKPLWWHEQGLQYNASGYGRAIPTIYQVRWNGRWYRVKACVYSNAGTCYIGKPGAWIATVGD